MSQQLRDSVIKAIADLPPIEFEHKSLPKQTIENVNKEFEKLLNSDFVQKNNSTPKECEEDALGIMRGRYPWVNWSNVN